MAGEGVKIGLEIHVPLNTSQKLFCSCPTNYYEVEEPNINTCPVCTGMPGCKPYPINERVLESAVMVSRLLDCKTVEEGIFVKRKHYNYPDLPSGYQRTSEPVGVEGELNGVGIWELHFEEDPGRYDLATGRVDYNRSGVPLIEIVTAPDMHSPDEARNFMRELLNLLKYTNRIIDVGGVLRADVNISIEGGARVEIKNINSVKGAFKAIQFELIRQRNLMKRGGVVKQETRGFNEKTMITTSLRTKETAADYRYIPDPDIPPVSLSSEFINSIELPETPQTRRRRLVEEYNISLDYASTLVKDKDLVDCFDEGNTILVSNTSNRAAETTEPSDDGSVLISSTSNLAVRDRGSEATAPILISATPNLEASKWDSNTTARWFTQEVLKQLNYRNIDFKESKLNSEILVELLSMVRDGKITDEVGKKLLERVIDSGESPKEIVEKEGLGKVSDADELAKVVDKILEEHGQAVVDYKAGKNESFNYLVGQIMRQMKGRADHQIVSKLLQDKLA